MAHLEAARADHFISHDAPAPKRDLGRVASYMSRLIGEHAGVQEVGEVLVRAAMEVVPAASAASVSGFDDQGRLLSPSGEGMARDLDRLQKDLCEGPSLDVAGAFRWTCLRSDDLRADGRWPRLAREVPPFRARSLLSVTLMVNPPIDGPTDAPTLRALNVYAAEPAAFSDDDGSLLTMLALSCSMGTNTGAVLDAAAKHIDHLRTALQTRNVIGQAQGILMERHHLTADEAFESLRSTSQRSNRKLRDVAERIAETGSES